jgi:hypothetical protein
MNPPADTRPFPRRDRDAAACDHPDMRDRIILGATFVHNDAGDGAARSGEKAKRRSP